MNLRIPGPTPLPPGVRAALGEEMIDHRGIQFEELLQEVTSQLRYFYQTARDVLILTASGTGGLEAALVNVLSPGDHVVAVVTGHFGQRWADIARAFGAEVTQLDFPAGQALQAAAVARALQEDADIRLLLTTHNETSTGVLNDLAPLAGLLHGMNEARPLWLVDAVSSLGAVELPMDEWGCDLVISASQKAWMSPPGLAFVGVSQRAWERMAEARCPRFYWDLRTARTYAAKGQTPFTPAVSALFGLREALRRMREEDLPAIVERHRSLAAQTRKGLQALGLRPLAAEASASPTVTAVHVPAGVSAVELRGWLWSEHGVAVAAGMGAAKDRVLRVAHMGYCTPADIDNVLLALGTVLEQYQRLEGPCGAS
jgi:aspartate aminotransferase-like enzyme